MSAWPEFMWVALAAAVLLGAVGGWIGPLVIQRRQAFLGAGLAHVAFAGVALGMLLQRWWPGLDPSWVAWPVTLATALGISGLVARRGLAADTAIGVAFAVAMAAAVIALGFVPVGGRDATTYLFGSLLALDAADLALLAILLLAVLVTLPLWSRWAYATFDRDLARADGLTVTRDDAVLATLVATVVVAGVSLVGALLIAALLVLPAAAARPLGRTLFTTSFAAVVIGVLSAASGVWAAWRLDLPPGPCIVVAAGLVFVGSLVASPRDSSF